MRSRIAAVLTRRLYRNPVIADLPQSKLYFLLAYGTWAKVLNYLRVRRDFKAMRTRVTSLPYLIRAEPVSRCNLHCPLCPMGQGEIDRGNAVMRPEIFDAILERCGSRALYAALWIWGEPLLNKALPELVRVCKRRGIGTEVSTHLSLPLGQQRIDELIRSGLDWLIVSNDAASAPVYEQYRIGGSFEQVMTNLRALVERKRALRSVTPFIEWQFVTLKHNEHEMQRAAELAREIGVDGLRFKPARLDKTGGLTFGGDLSDDLGRKWAPSDPRLVHVATRERPSFVDHHCSFLWVSASVYSDGSVAPCCETTSKKDDLGNVLHDDFDSIWNGPAYVTARRVALGGAESAEERRTACHGCKVFAKPLATARPRAVATPLEQIT